MFGVPIAAAGFVVLGGALVAQVIIVPVLKITVFPLMDAIIHAAMKK